MKNWTVLFLSLVVAMSALFSQEIRDKAGYCEYENKYWQKIVEEIEKFETPPKEKPMQFKMDFSTRAWPTSPSMYTAHWHGPLISQGNSGTCWDFSTTSFFEAEIYRIHGKQVKLSEMYTMYWETVEKARRFVRERGESLFDEGSEANAVVRMWKMYGIVPAEAYTAQKPGQEFHNHEKIYVEMKKYLESVKRDGAWNEELVVGTIQAILNHYMGKPPDSVVVDGKTMTPKAYLASLKLDLDDYLDLMSLVARPYYQMAEYKVPDNWWHSAEYFNIPLDDFIWVLRNALRNGYTVCLGGDVSEAGYHIVEEVAVVPSFDIPARYIDEYARQLRFDNKCTTDDHGVHCVGWMEKDGENWYLIKDSASGARTGKNFGYMFYREDYIKLKMMNIMVHKDAAKPIWEKYQAIQSKP